MNTFRSSPSWESSEHYCSHGYWQESYTSDGSRIREKLLCSRSELYRASSHSSSLRAPARTRFASPLTGSAFSFCLHSRRESFFLRGRTERDKDRKSAV